MDKTVWHKRLVCKCGHHVRDPRTFYNDICNDYCCPDCGKINKNSDWKTKVMKLTIPKLSINPKTWFCKSVWVELGENGE